MDQDRLDGLTVFIAVARRGNFAAAAAELGLSRSAVSVAVRKLEDRLGVALFTRTTRSVGLTEAGRGLYERSGPLIDELDESLSEATGLGHGPTGTLRLSVPRVALGPVIEPILRRFAEAAPAVTLDLVLDDGLVDLARDGYDAGIRLGDQVDADMIGRNLTGPLPWQVVGAPDYLVRHGIPEKPDDLLCHACIGYRLTTSQTTYRWELLKNGRLTPHTVRQTIIVNDPTAKRAAARAGVGLAYDLATTFEEDVNAGALRPVLEAFCQTSPGLFLYYPARHQVMPKLRAFIDVICR